MQQMIRITEIQERATALGLSLRAICLAAGVQFASPYRWLKGDSDPKLGNYDATCAALEATLDVLEEQQLAYLQRRRESAGRESAA